MLSSKCQLLHIGFTYLGSLVGATAFQFVAVSSNNSSYYLALNFVSVDTILQQYDFSIQ
jgi:hypothetical protein